VKHDRCDAGEVHVFALQHAKRDATCHAGIDRIAARFENRKAGLGRQVVGR
jgi:hypothetical protein